VFYILVSLCGTRGGNALVSYIQRNTRIPVLGHADGICHMYIDEAASLEMALKVRAVSRDNLG
jgi:gamma-glutamyl phosphate reductase